MSKSLPIDGISAAIVRELSKYTNNLADGIKQDAREVSKDLIKNLKRDSPKNTTEYSTGWRAKVEIDTRDEITVRVHNAKKPWITHLLEKGHAQRGGGRTPAKVHIASNEKLAIEEFEKRVEERIRNGG